MRNKNARIIRAGACTVYVLQDLIVHREALLTVIARLVRTKTNKAKLNASNVPLVTFVCSAQ